MCQRTWRFLGASRPLASVGMAMLVMEMRQVGCSSAYLAGWYQASRPDCRRFAAASGASVPLITDEPTTQDSFSRFGVPRDRIWYVGRMVDSHLARQLTNSLASGSFSSTGALLRLKNPGKALE